jgi:Pyruvate/2-oxoacid:ferredoxin oxidoreductase gamma subunit
MNGNDTQDAARDTDALPTGDLDVLVAGLGGMGVVGLTRRLGTLLRTRHPRVYSTENRGFGQRRASVAGTVRAGRRVRSPELLAGAGVVVALEPGEAVRHEQMVRPGAWVLLSDACVWPGGAEGRNFESPGAADIAARLGRRGARVLSLPVASWLREHGLSDVFVSTAMLGAFAALVGFGLEQVGRLVASTWGEADREVNLRALEYGFGAALAAVAETAPVAAAA